MLLEQEAARRVGGNRRGSLQEAVISGGTAQWCEHSDQAAGAIADKS